MLYQNLVDLLILIYQVLCMVWIHNKIKIKIIFIIKYKKVKNIIENIINKVDNNKDNKIQEINN